MDTAILYCTKIKTCDEKKVDYRHSCIVTDLCLDV